jgi:hypothetical protein
MSTTGRFLHVESSNYSTTGVVEVHHFLDTASSLQSRLQKSIDRDNVRFQISSDVDNILHHDQTASGIIDGQIRVARQSVAPKQFSESVWFLWNRDCDDRFLQTHPYIPNMT